MHTFKNILVAVVFFSIIAAPYIGVILDLNSGNDLAQRILENKQQTTVLVVASDE